MHKRHRALVASFSILIVLVACGAPRSTVTPLPPTATSVAAVATETLPPTSEPTAPSPTATPTVLPATPSPTSTSAQVAQPPTETAPPVPESPPVPPSVDQILAGLEGLPLDRFMEESYRQLQLRDPDTLLMNGLASDYGLEPSRWFTDRSDTYNRETQRLEAAVLDLLRSYDLTDLTREQRLSYDVYEWYLDDLVRGHEFMYYNYLVNSLGNWDTVDWVFRFMVEAQPVEDEQAAQDYIARLSQLDTLADQLLEGLELREQAGVMLPHFLLARSVQQLENRLFMRRDLTFYGEGIELYTSFREKLRGVDELSIERKQALLDAALTEIEETAIPALDTVRKYLVRQDARTTNEAGVWKFPNGDAYYAYILRHHTGTDLTPEEVHELGLAEVARIQSEMRSAAAELGYSPELSMADLDQLISEETDLVEGDALLAEYERLIAQADEAAADYFDLYPSAPPVVEYDPNAPIGYYQPPPLDGSGPGKMPSNLQNPARYTLYNVPVLVHHETIPGHHVQQAVAQELGLPNFRRDNIFNVYRHHLPFQAYVEGWAFYAEQLAWEMGLYEEDPLGNLGRLRLELHRTARMVVDTGIHALGWTVGEATDYMAGATGTPYAPEQLYQIIAIPGQACGYNVGRIKILELRQRAMDQLGDRFDIKEFHNVVLGHGSMPLAVLERVVDDWIAARGGSAGGPGEWPAAVGTENAFMIQ